MAKILVADDNSNVQKTVALALADLGIEVIAVNNGEAAVKKLPDVMPDLVLADIFMPVRNGYEVCEYVKKDSRFSQVPVVLLVGAFDPLDEREAQRVGADGILKKPFVPPDPLIAMVKTLLERTVGERLVPAAVAAVAKPAMAKQSRSGGVAVADDHNSGPAIADEPQEEPLRPMPSRMSFEDGEGLVAFSQLLETPELKVSASRGAIAETEDNDQILTSQRDESLGAPIFWKSSSAEPEVDSADSETNEEDDSTEIPAIGWRPASESPAAQAKVEVAPSIPEEPLVLVHDEKDEVTNQVSTVVESSPQLVQDPATQASLTVEASKAADLAANPLEWMASVPLPKQEEAATSNVFEWSATVPEPKENIEVKAPETSEPATELATAELPAVHLPPVAAIPNIEAASKSEENLPILEPAISAIPQAAVLLVTQTPSSAAQSVEDTVRSAPKQEWSDLAATPENVEPGTASKQVAKSVQVQEEHKLPESPKIAEQPVAASSSWNSAPASPKLPTPSGENGSGSLPKHDWADLVSDLQSQTVESKPEKSAATTETPIQQTAAVETKAEQPAPEPAIAASKPLNGRPEDTARSLPKLDWADLAASIPPKSAESATENNKTANSSAAFSAPSSPATLNGKPTTISALAAALERASQQGNGSNTPAQAASEASPPSTPQVPSALGAASGAVSGAVSEAVSGAGSATPDPALVEAVVQRVLDKMRPQVVDIITKEFLRPVVQALVHREITKR